MEDVLLEGATHFKLQPGFHQLEYNNQVLQDKQYFVVIIGTDSTPAVYMTQKH